MTDLSEYGKPSREPLDRAERFLAKVLRLWRRLFRR